MDQLPIEGTLNFRAVAPYAAAGGRLRRNTLFRSGEFHDVGLPGLEGLRALGVTTAFDLRSDTEKSRRPSPLLAAAGFRVVSEAHDFRNGDLRAVLDGASSTADDCAGVMRSIYATLPTQFAASYARYFREVADCRSPIAIHCAAGKDRTGVGVALLLDIVGVSRDDIQDDYLKTNAVRERLRQRFSGHNSALGYSAYADHLVEPVIVADPAYLSAMFAAVEKTFGDTRRYAAEALGMSDDEIERLRQRLVA